IYYLYEEGSFEKRLTTMPLEMALIKIENDSKSVVAQYSYKHNKNENLRRGSYIFDALIAGIRSGDLSVLFSTERSIEN
ncbi:zinc metalloprotease HtpX, partial [Francisella tularensis subsp. holarctica]|nr:zinc metalloprotease HtpX [Francisella tularensis subsp. holarctica]